MEWLVEHCSTRESAARVYSLSMESTSAVGFNARIAGRTKAAGSNSIRVATIGSEWITKIDSADD